MNDDPVTSPRDAAVRSGVAFCDGPSSVWGSNPRPIRSSVVVAALLDHMHDEGVIEYPERAAATGGDE